MLVDTKHMAERKGEIKARLPQLENDLQMYQRELDDYRSTLDTSSSGDPGCSGFLRLHASKCYHGEVGLAGVRCAHAS